MERILRNIFLTLLLLTMLLLLGSGRSGDLKAAPSEAENAASRIGSIVPRSDRNEWAQAARKRPLWLIRIASF